MDSPEQRAAATADDNRKAATQARILDAAAQLFITQGYERTSISGIASRARVSRAAVFWHFGTKAGLFEETVRRLLGPFLEEIRGSLSHLPPRKRIFELIDLYESFVTTWREPILGFVRWALESPEAWAKLQAPLFSLHDVFLKDLSEAFEELLHDRGEAERLAAVMTSTLDGTLLLDVLEHDEVHRKLRREGLRSLVKHALADAAKD
jgi:AcrR family transcriptional regulator